MLTENKSQLLKIADELLAREVLDADQVQRLAKGLALDAPTPAPASGDAPRTEATDRPAIVLPIPKPITQA